ncbi:UNKNOWN [Stylonychia lemnae]|uniref:Phosphoglycerate mutase family protein n=1 Tax=Stylonychia lemnae TaxID=5949 RepID=A0A077ZY88_STYLE|nr:UNKNOWN [Stylonychia lemnae]|eukprot:CDW74856.1 UNKNOWN [Stylonychia lemnae]
MDQHNLSRLQKLHTSKFIIIRHANSTFNFKWEKTTEDIQHGIETEDKYVSIIQDTTLLDCPLSDLGIQQCKDSARLAHTLPDVKTVFISPLRRALQTAYLLFKEHPQFSKIHFVVHPLLRENTHTVCDIPESLESVKAEYLTKIPNLDFSLIGESLSDDQKKIWYFYDYQEPVRSYLLSRYEQEQETKDEKQIMLEEIIKTYPDRLEDVFNTYLRREKFKQFLIEYQRSKGKHSGQVCIVGHSQFFSHLTATQWPKKPIEDSEEVEFDQSKHPTKFKWLQNYKGVQKQTRTFKLDLKSTRNDDSKIKIASLLDNAMIPKIFPDQYTSGNQLERQAIALSLKQYDGNNNYFPQQQSQTQRRNVSQLELMNKNEISGQRFNTKYFNNQELETSKYQETKLIGFPILQLDQKSKYDIDVQGKAEVIPIIEPYRPMKFNDYQYPSARDVSKNKLDGTIGINNALENYRSQINKSGLTENVQIMRPISSLTNNTISYENQITYINEGQQIDPPSLLGYPFKDLTEYKHHIETLQNNDEQADSINDNSVGFNQNNTNTSIIQLKEKPTFWNKFESLIGEKFERQSKYEQGVLKLRGATNDKRSNIDQKEA